MKYILYIIDIGEICVIDVLGVYSFMTNVCFKMLFALMNKLFF